MNRSALAKTVTARVLLGCLPFLAACALAAATSAQTVTIRVVTYNIMDDISGFTTPLAGLITPFSGTGGFTNGSSGTVTDGGVLEGIGEEILSGTNHPLDILALQETTSNGTTIQPIVDGLNAFYSSRGINAGYAMSPVQATSCCSDVADGNGPNALVYNTNTVQLVASVGINTPTSSSGAYRQVMRYLFAPAGVTATTNNEFYMYVSHYKAGSTTSDLDARSKEAGIIRTNSASLPSNSRVVYAGDYNVGSSTEASYQAIVSTNLVGIRGIDPFNPTGSVGLNWANNILLNQKTESAQSLHYRDDFQCMSSNMYNGVAGGWAYVPGTYHTFGNNGSVLYNNSVITGNTALDTDLQVNPPISAAQCYTNLYGASDHYPVVADYTLLGPAVPPVASFNATPTNGVAPLNVSFTDTSTGTPTSWAWTFGDSTNSTAQNPSHTYTAPGTYTVQLIASNASGSSTNTRTNLITVLTPPPVASFTGSPTNGTEPLLVTFSDTSTGSITSRYWDFGDSNTTTVATNSVSHTYAAGTYTVMLVVTGPGGVSTNTKPNYITAYTAFQSWQVLYFGSTTNVAAAPGADPDGDGQGNQAEFLSGTDPTNNASSLHITAATTQGYDILVSWATALGHTNVVQATAGLPDGSYQTNFTDLSPLIILPPGSGDTSTNYLDAGGATNVPARYYRVRLQP